MRKKTKNRHGGLGLQVLLLMLVMLVGGITNIQAQAYITDVIVLGNYDSALDAKNLRNEYTNKGWTVLEQDLNAGTGGWWVYIAYKTSSTANPYSGYITDICASDQKMDSFTSDGRTYYRAPTNSDFNGDLNKGSGVMPDIYIYFTRDRKNLSDYGGSKRVMTRLSTTRSTKKNPDDGDNSSLAVSWRNSSYSGYLDTNENTSADYIYIHQHFTTQTAKWKREPTYASDLTYNGNSQRLITYDPISDNVGYTVFRVNDGSWSGTVPTATNVGRYKVDSRLNGTYSGNTFADNSNVISKTVTINPPIVKATNLKGVFNQRDKKVNLSWSVGTIPGNYSDYKWVVYRDGKKIAELAQNVRAYADTGFSNEAKPVYDVYYVSNFWDVTTRRDDTKASVTVSTTRTMPVKNLKAEQLSDRIVFTWNSDAYPKSFGHKFRIYVNDEKDPIYTLTPADNQSAMRWEHRTTDQHTNRQNKVDAATGVPYTEEPLSACSPRTYRIVGVIGDAVLNTYNISKKAIGEGTKFYALDASKGVYEGSVKLSWHVNLQGNTSAKTYIIERRRAEQESEAWETLTRLSSSEEYLFYTDATSQPGIYYDYRVTVEDKCDDGTIVNSDMTNIGFAKSTGTVTGRIAYGSSGTAVQGVDVAMTMTNSDGKEAEQYHSIYFSDATGVVTWPYPSSDYAANLFAGDFSIQLWLYPETFSKGLIAHLGGNAGLGMTAAGQLTFTGGTTTQTFNGITLQKESYNHVVLTRSGTTLTCYVLTKNGGSGDPTVQKATLTIAGSQWPLTNASQFELGHFKGAADELRLWAKCLSEADIVGNYDHLLVGDEQQLETYWTFDEGLRTQFFDYSRDGSNYHKHHGLIGSNAQSSTLTPGALRLRAKTDAEGNYIIQGVPFTGAGTTYSVIPLYGVHEFNPNKTLLYVGYNSLVHTADFEDVSSFPMEGRITYAGTNIPVEGIQLYVDGQLQTNDGEVQQTDANGEYRISVPIGKHYVEAKLGGHKIVAGGRFPITGKCDFSAPVTYDFQDSTLVNFVGRVSGGEKNDTLAVGFGASNNNIGKARITLMMNNESLLFNYYNDQMGTEERPFQSDTTAIQSTAWAGKGSDAKYIYIDTDPKTGEFSALLPPLKYIVKSIEIPKNPGIEFTTLPQIDLTNVLKTESDSLQQISENGDSVYNYYKYHTKMVKTYYAQPQVEITQPDMDKGIFGVQTYEDEDALGKFTVSDLWTQADNGSVTYKYGYPIYKMGDSYKLSFYGYETYTNNDGSEAVTDTIPLIGQVLTIGNEMSSDQSVICVVENENSGLQPGQVYDLKKNQLVLDSLGRSTIQFNAGAPNVVSPYTRHVSVTLVRQNRTYSPVSLDAIVVGSLPLGNNFVTNGPDNVLMVLRDPPGAKSKTVWKRGSVTSHVTSVADGGYGDEKITNTVNLGAHIRTMAGVGLVMQSTDLDHTFDYGLGLHYKWTATSSTERSWTTTATQDVSTSTGSTFVGSKGDVYIGYSTNLLMGQCRKVGFFRENESAPFTLKDDVAVSLGDSVTTNFMYSANEIENVMIPKWEETRNSYLTQHFATEAEARAFVNNTSDVLFATWLNKDDDNYGAEGTYVMVIPEEWKIKEGFVADDKVQWCNNQIDSWKQTIANNERDKVKSMANVKNWLRNVSFDGGSSYTYTNKNDETTIDKFTHSHTLGGIIKLGATNKDEASGVQFKAVFSVDTENGYSRTETESDKESSYAEFDYVFDDGNKGTDFSVDIYKSQAGWSDIFFLFGGQSYNPYEAEEKTKYYEPGQHTLSNGTEQMEHPDIQISTDGTIAAKSAVLTDVPAGQAGQFTLHLSNASTTTQGFDFTYQLSIAEGSNQQGLEILMDGVPASGRGIYIPAGETVKKVITVRQTDQSVLDYENIELWFSSAYQSIKIHDIAKLSVHFKPSSSAVELAISEPVLNCSTDSAKLEMKVKGFNRQFKNLKNVGVQYRFQGNTQWVDLHTWVTDKADSTSTAFSLMPATGDIPYAVKMLSDLAYPEGSYEFRAFTTTPYGNENIQVYSDIITVIKDMTRPRNLYTPAPANGILGYGDQLAIEFNEDIVPGYVNADNIIVTAKLNQQPVDHNVSLTITPLFEAKTVNPVFLNGDFSMEMWVNVSMLSGLLSNGTVLHQGAGTDNFALGFDETDHATVTIAGKKFTSEKTVPTNQWMFLCMNYRASDMKFNMLALTDTMNIALFEDEQVTLGDVQAINYASDNHLYLGGFMGDIHGLALYNIWRDVHDMASTKNQAKDGYVYGLANYWAMNEGHGTIAADARHTHDFIVPEAWNIDRMNQKMSVTGNEGAKADISRIVTGVGDSYAIELWYRSSAHKDEVVWETATPTVDGDKLAPTSKLRLRYDDKRNLVLRYGADSVTVAVQKELPTADAWHHYALNVVRGQAASFYIDGKRTAVIAETAVPNIEGSTLILGKGDAADIDEVRVWKASLSESRLLNNMYNTLDTASVYSKGLAAYYPFEKDSVVAGVPMVVYTADNMAPGATDSLTFDKQQVHFGTFGAPPIKHAPRETKLIASPVASERKVVVNLTGAGISLRDIEGTTLNVTVDRIHDLYGNESQPIRWTAYVQQNTLKWTKDSVNIIKKYGDSHTFDVVIENKSGNTEYYTLYNMPQWLSLVGSTASDEINPLSTKVLRFQVNPLVPVGNYDVTIGVQGNNQILEPLRVVMKVRGETPQWTVDPTLYEHQMNYIGQVRIGGILIENSESMVAAFIGDECRGVASPERVRGAAYVTMTVYGNGDTDAGKPLSFRIWDASAGIAYTDVRINAFNGAAIDNTFQLNAVRGSFDQPVIWTKGDNVEQNLKLTTNWNWVSLGVRPADQRPAAVFPLLTPWKVFIKDKTSAMIFSNGNNWMPEDARIQAATMYKVKITPAVEGQQLPEQVPVTGEQLKLSKTPVTLTPGWNWIGYTTLTTMTVGEALAAANPQVGDCVKSQHGIAFYSQNGWEGSLKALESGHGYMYNSTASEEKSFVYPDATGTRRAAARRTLLNAESQSESQKTRLFAPTVGNYPDNMSMVISLKDGEQSVDTCEVAAYIGGECRGATRANGGLYYLIIAGEGSGQPLELRTCINGETVVIDNTQTYISDVNIGTPWNPYVIDMSAVLTGISTIAADDADDDSDWWTLQGFKIGRKPTQSGVYIHHGNKVTIKRVK
ncbi:LamG domain-containing protein [Prevotella communis]|uniref:LamG domain-containing protein n=1 Tax=Prevotella communis TaxID=2913614 RepID=UPI001EDA2CB8|nr:LamG domain-containing protein [Prevotella communis]UKK56668.1 LamG domain-containing protein [Prevotella communis]